LATSFGEIDRALAVIAGAAAEQRIDQGVGI
jgi:hypothetical protein